MRIFWDVDAAATLDEMRGDEATSCGASFPNSIWY
jgi:hypothetical protein